MNEYMYLGNQEMSRPCIAAHIRNTYDTWAEMFTAGRKIGKMYTRGSERTKWFAIVFKDNSRLGFRYHDGDFRLYSWFYYNYRTKHHA